MRSERDARGWSQADAVRAMRAKSSHNLPTDSTLLRNWRRWESGESRPDDFYAPIIAAAFDTVTAAFFPKARPNRDDELLSSTGMDTLEFIGRLRMSDVSSATLDAIRITAERLCCEYPCADPLELHSEGTAWLRRITSLLDGRLTLAQHREVLVLAGWVALLVGCVDYDLGWRTTAEATRRAALSLGQEAEHVEIQGWGAEMAAWFALTQGNYRGAIDAAEGGLATTGQHGVGVQLAAQQAKAWARIGDRQAMENALRRGRTILERLDHPANLDNHFVVDPQKFDFYAMDCCRVAGDDRLAESYARQVIRTSTGPDGSIRKPMRVSEAQLTLAVVAVRDRDLELAVDEGMRAFAGKRRSLPSLLWIAGEAAREMIERFPGDPRTRNYLDQLRSLAAS
ncbi:XRE family transcriptional regulator [Nocardia pseudobrasiliensis]|nr:XRE family transcriptional regulator [Nocardia pseudobrasiliensis]